MFLTFSSSTFLKASNTRVQFSDLDGDGQISLNAQDGEVMQVLAYYPFGMTIEGLNPADLSDPAYRYRCNGKEEEPNTRMYDYGAQWYMPDIGRWGVVDLLADWATDIKPFRYGINNPIMNTDPDGLFETWWEARKHRRANNLKGRIRENQESGVFETHLRNADGRISRNSKTKELEYAVVETFTGHSIRAHKPNKWEQFKNINFITGVSYGIINDAWLTTKRFNPFDTHTTHLAGHYASKDEYSLAFVNTVATGIPIGRATSTVQSLTPTGFTLLNRLNAAQFSKRFRGTMLARTHPRKRGRLNRLLNSGVDQVNTKVETGNLLIQGAKISGNTSNKEY